MVCVCEFNPISDIKEVTPGQFIDIFECVSTGVVLPVSKESFYNEIDDIKKVGNRIRDTFDALEASGLLAEKVSSSSEPNT